MFTSNLSSSSKFPTRALASSQASVTSRATHRRGQPTATAIHFPFSFKPQCAMHISSNKHIKPADIWEASSYSYGSPQASNIPATLPHIQVKGQLGISRMDTFPKTYFFGLLLGSPFTGLQPLGIPQRKSETGPLTCRARRDGKRQAAANQQVAVSIIRGTYMQSFSQTQAEQFLAPPPKP